MEKRRWRQPQQKESHRNNGAVGRDDDTVEIVGKSAKGIGEKEGARDGGNEVLGVGKKKKKILKRTGGGGGAMYCTDGSISRAGNNNGTI